MRRNSLHFRRKNRKKQACIGRDYQQDHHGAERKGSQQVERAINAAACQARNAQSHAGHEHWTKHKGNGGSVCNRRINHQVSQSGKECQRRNQCQGRTREKQLSPVLPIHAAFHTAYFASYTVFPPTTVRKTLVPSICEAGTTVMSRSSTTKSASIPGASVPLDFSSNSAYADPVVYAAIACSMLSFSSG